MSNPVAHCSKEPANVQEQFVPGMTLRDTNLPTRKIENREMRIVHNSNLSVEERKAIGKRTRRVFAEKKANRQQTAQRLHAYRKLKIESMASTSAESAVEKPEAPTTSTDDSIGKRIASMERVRRFKHVCPEAKGSKAIWKKTKRSKRRQNCQNNKNTSSVEGEQDEPKVIEKESEIIPANEENQPDLPSDASENIQIQKNTVTKASEAPVNTIEQVTVLQESVIQL